MPLDNTQLYGILFNGTNRGLYGDPEQFWAAAKTAPVYDQISSARAAAAQAATNQDGRGVLVGTPVVDPTTGQVSYAAYSGQPVVARDLNGLRGIGHGKMRKRKFLRKNGFNAFNTEGDLGAGLYHYNGDMSRHLYRLIMRNQRHARRDMLTALELEDPDARPEWWNDPGMQTPYSKLAAEGEYYTYDTMKPYTISAIGSTTKPDGTTDGSGDKNGKKLDSKSGKLDKLDKTNKPSGASGSSSSSLGTGSAKWNGVDRVSTKNFTVGFKELKQAFEADFGSGSFAGTFGKNVKDWLSLFNYIWKEKNHGGLSKGAALGVGNDIFINRNNGALNSKFIKYMKSKGQSYLSKKTPSKRIGGRLLWRPFNPAYYI